MPASLPLPLVSPDAGTLIVGLMSGMSADGLDLALVRITPDAARPDRPKVELVRGDSYPYDDERRARIRAAQTAGPDGVAALHAELGQHWGKEVADFLDLAKVAPADITAVASHGQTIHHTPRQGDTPAITLQVGDPARIAARSGIPVVADFRQADIAAGGEGAPLIPLADWILFGVEGETTACQNLGNIANVTVLPASRDEILAFDTGPANALIDAAVRSDPAGGDTGGVDQDGRISAAGTVNDDLLLALYTRRSEWMVAKPPKSAGYETFGTGLFAEVGDVFTRLSLADRVRTVVEFTALALRDAYAWHVVTLHPELERIRFSGGGCHNTTLMARIADLIEPLGLRVETLDATWTDLKEAVGFALLADRTLRGLPGNVPSATGARHDAILGTLTLPPG